MIVGVCAAGKTTLSAGLRGLGYNAKSLAQEHSVTPRLWERRNPDFLVLLDCQFSTIQARKHVSWGVEKYIKQKEILEYARSNADLIVVTDQFSPDELVEYVAVKLAERGIYPEQGEV